MKQFVRQNFNILLFWAGLSIFSACFFGKYGVGAVALAFALIQIL